MFVLKKDWFLTVSITLSVFLAGCGSGQAEEGVAQYTSTIENIDIPDDVKVIGFGEATHGNIEFQELKKDLFQALIVNEDVRVFVLEGDFGGAQQINQFILTGNGTAEEAVNALDYSIYRTEQMIAFVQWMHDYNKSVDENEKVYFYGNDMQRYDYSKEGLLSYFGKVNGDEAKGYAAKSEHVSNETMRELTNSQLEELDATMDAILSDLQANRTAYIRQSSEESFAMASQYVQIMKQRTQLFLNDSNYAHLRDQYLAENLQWIVDFEAACGHDKVLISGHNGHIEKTSASLAGYKAMGDYLDEIYGEAYFAIGTDFIDNTFQALNGGSGERENYTLVHHNDLVDAFRDVEENIFYVDFEKASASQKLKAILSTEQKMGNVGDDFRSWYKFTKMFYTIEMIPNEAYDGLIIVKEATPTTVFN
ncbi:erythromycin esterase family protein [Solibacillus sp. FSL K6-1523]|uniref:erythromycin esterase family protein n=1 Tax=Solibacillus sp. FSL K6-1523 TaxID=2921471 RepID=UPI004046FB0A